MKCKECCENEAVVEQANISIRCSGKAIEIVADSVCLECLKKSLDLEKKNKKLYIRIPEHSRRVPSGVKRVRAHIRKIR